MWKFDNKTPIYLQILDQMILKIITGIYKPGEKLPSVRDLALETKTNPNTIQKALAELELQDFINTQRTNGKFVTNDLTLIHKHRHQLINEKIMFFSNEMKHLGITLEEIIEQLQQTKGK